MSSKTFLGVLAVAVMLMSGCAYKAIEHGQEISQQDATAKLVRGSTTKQQVFLDFGEPTKTAENGSVFFYSWTRGSKVAVMGIGSGSAEGNSLVIIFDEAGVVKDYRITRGAVESGQID